MSSTEPPAPGVSVLLACFRSKWLEEAIQSVLSQSYQDFELLVLDDADDRSTRNTTTSFDDPRVRYLPSSAGPLGPAANHNRGLQLARGEMVAIINHDDVWRPDLLLRLRNALVSHPEAVAAFSDHGCIDSDGVQMQEQAAQLRRTYAREGLAEGLHRPFRDLAVVTRSVPVAQSVLWRRDAVPAIPGRAHGAYDLWLAYWLSRDGRGAAYIGVQLADWRIAPGNLSSSPSWRKDFGGMWVLAQIAQDPLMRGQRRHVIVQLSSTMRQSLKVRLSGLREKVGSTSTRRGNYSELRGRDVGTQDARPHPRL